ncbi:hypothetical protein TWF594_011390 [Orbilia oligospora]|nr:hypothetical protein TWF706_003878 [Orbilia oligospora]KAF3149346.1 hypothetical protein TWF594_011390 [Orbilia oligospora]
MASDPPAVSLTTLPTELTFHILSFLSPIEYKAFSSTSKTCRKACIPIIFRRVRLYPENIQLWQNNPAICIAVRRVSFYPLYINSETELMDYWRICTNAVGLLFPNITDLKLLYPSSSYYLQQRDVNERDSLDDKLLQLDNRIFSAIFSTLSTFPFYDSQLRKLHIETNRFWSAGEQYPSDISTENQEFLDSTDRVMAAKGLDHIPFPHMLEEAILTAKFIYFTPPGYNLHNFIALQNCMNSLRSFSFLGTPDHSTKRFSRGNRPKDEYIKNPILWLNISDYIYPNVTTLCISSRFLTNEYIYEFPVRFPSLQELRIHDPSAKVGLMITENFEEVTKMLRAFKGLKRVVVPWPLEDTNDLDWEKPGWDPVPPVAVENIGKTARAWFADESLVALERIAFWMWDVVEKETRCEAVISERRFGVDGGVHVRKVKCTDREELFPILGKGWDPICWVDHSKRLARTGMVIG